jgi:hypothetical protein
VTSANVGNLIDGNGVTISVYHSGVITLVHGTWPRGLFPKWLNMMRLLGLSKPKPLWFESESPFRKELELELKDASLDCEIRPFCWSGANSIFARDEAAQKLARVLKIQQCCAHRHRPQPWRKRRTASHDSPWSRH